MSKNQSFSKSFLWIYKGVLVLEVKKPILEEFSFAKLMV